MNREQIDAALRDAGAVLAAGGLVVFPTETVYGIGCRAGSAEAVAKLRAFKGQHDGGFALHLPSPEDVRRYITTPSRRVLGLIEKLLARPITLRLVLRDGMTLRDDAPLSDQERGQIIHDDVIALRCPAPVLTSRLLDASPSAIIASGAAAPGTSLPTDAQQAAAATAGVADYLIDGGPCRFAKASTAVRLSITKGSPVVVLEREGALDKRTVERISRFTILLVCTGNTCRSPMAHVLTRKAIALRLGIEPNELSAAGFEVSSAGVFASSGAPASPEAVDAVKRLGLDLSGHRSTPLSRSLAAEADLILCMSASHVRSVLELAPDAAGRVMRLDAEADVADPIGLDIAAYHRTADQISRAIEIRLQELLS